MVIGALRVRLLIPGANSLKDKRSVLKRIIARLRTRHNCAVGEIDDQNVWRSAVLGIVTVYASKGPVESLLRSVMAELEAGTEFEVLDQDIEIL